MRRRWRGSLGDFSSLQDEVYRLVDDSLSRVGDLWQGKAGELRPRADIYDCETEFKIYVDIPGIAKDDLSIALVGRTLTVGGHKAKPEESDEKQLRVGERFYGRCHRTFEFDCDVDGDNVSATAADGVLCLIVPKRDEEKARKIEIKAG